MTLRVHPDEIVAKSSSGMLATHSSWERVRLDQIASVLNGCAFPSTGFGRSGDMPLIRIRDVGRKSTGTWYTGAFEPQYVVENGSLIAGMDGEFRVDTWRGPPSLLNQRVCKIEVRNPALYSERFLRWVLPGYLEAVHRETSSVTVKHLSSRTIKELPLPLPPIAEQKRIVTAIEEQFSRLDAAAVSLERIGQNLTRMRASVMEAAVAGRLGSDPQASRPKSGLPDGWNWQSLEAIITRLRNGVFVSRPGSDVTERPILRISAVRPMALDVRDVRYVSQTVEVDPDGSFLLEPGDLLFTRYSGNPEYVGACAMVPFQVPPLLYPDKLIRVQVDHALVDPRFVEIAANVGETRRVIRSRVKTTAGQTGISGGDLKSVPFPVPTLTVQRRIVDEVDVALAPTKRLEEQLESMVRRSSSLRATILMSAFSGELVPQVPNDEPAAVLLERIAAECASYNGRKTTKARSPRRSKVNA